MSSEYYQDFFIVKDLAGNPLGFSSASLTKDGDANGSDFRGLTFYSRQQVGEMTSLKSDNHFNKLLWKSENTNQVMLVDGIMTAINAFGQKDYELSDAAIPEILFEIFLPQILDRFEDQIIIDMILNDGRIIPAVLTKSKIEENIIELKLLNNSDFTRNYYVDDNGRITKAVDRFEFIRATKQQVLESFPHAQNFLLELDELLK